MSTKKNKAVPITWLKMTEFMHGWLYYELGSELRISKCRVVCVQHLPGARDILRMETKKDLFEPGVGPTMNCMSVRRYLCMDAGIGIDPDVIQKMYGMTKELLGQFIPIECPKLCLTQNGVLRPWTMDVCFSKSQVTALQQMLREAFWEGVEGFARRYAREHEGEKYAQEDMITAFCQLTKTSELHIEAIRREWQRRQKRK